MATGGISDRERSMIIRIFFNIWDVQWWAKKTMHQQILFVRFRFFLILVAVLFTMHCGTGFDRLLDEPAPVPEPIVQGSPEINVQWVGIRESMSIYSGDSIDIGSVMIGGSKPVAVTIENSGDGDLHLTGSSAVLIIGADASQFAVSSPPGTTILPANSASCTILFAPTSVGQKTVTIVISSDDANEGVYTFTMLGTGTATIQPKMKLRLAVDSVPDNGSYSFGTVTVNPSSPPTATFYIENLGDDNLNLTGTSHVEITGPDYLLFSLTDNTSSPIAPSGWTSFDVAFAPDSEGDKAAAVRIENDDPDTEGYYEFTITGFGSATDIKIYWTDYDIDTIHRSNLDGSTIEDLVTGLSDPGGIALDITGIKMYWTESDAGIGSVFRADLSGANGEELITGLSDPRGIALDLDNSLMYWTDAGTGEIERSDFEGLSPETLIAGLAVPCGIALDSTGNRMYWICNGPSSLEDKICRAYLNGSNPEDLITGLDNPFGIALDTYNGKIYWTEGVNGPSTARIRRADLSTGDNRETLVTGLSEPRHIVIDLNGRRMYWTDAGCGKIQSSCLDGTDVVDLVTGITPCGIAIGD